VKDSSPPVRVGDVVDGKYRVERVVGSGGMGVVVAAEHLKLGRIVALKFLLKSACENREAVTRFLREGQALASITSAHVARVMDVGTLEQGEPYLVMEYLEGADFGAVLKRDGPFPVQTAVRYVLQVCEAVAEAHARGIIHRDLKPSNLFLTLGADRVPYVKVLDFGISKAVVQQSGATAEDMGPDAVTAPPAYVTNTGALVGSPLYMSPEQIRNARRVDERTDIWAIGVILYELICGTPPFEGETLAGTLAAVSADAPKLMLPLRDDVPVELERVIFCCLEKSPDKRFTSIAKLARALEPFAPADARSSVERISRLLGVHASAAGGQGTASATADESAPTVPSWEGNTVPQGVRSPIFRRRAWVALLLGALVAVGAWVVSGGAVQPPTSPSTSATLGAAPIAVSPSAGHDSTLAGAAPVAPTPALADAGVLAAADGSSAPKHDASKLSSALKQRPTPKPSKIASSGVDVNGAKHAEADGTEDRK
jgi:eukaryotic-like serine/threonine-protein kinase